MRQTDRNVLVSRDWMAPIARMVVVTCSLSETALLAIPCRSVPFQVSITLAKVLAIYRVPVPRHSWKVIDVSFRIYPNDDVIWTLQRCRRRAIFSKIFGESSVGSKCSPRDHQQPDSQGPHPIGHHLLPFFVAPPGRFSCCQVGR